MKGKVWLRFGRWLRQVQTLRPWRVLALLQAYGWQGLAQHGMARLQRSRPRRLQVWRWTCQAEPAPLPAGAQPLSASQLIDLAPGLRPFKRGVDALARQMAAGQGLALAWRQGDAVLGVTFLRPLAPGQWLSHDTFVYPGTRRKGLGEQLIRAAMALARQQDRGAAGTTVWGEVLPYNWASQAMLRRCGWQQVGEICRRGGQAPEVRPAELGYPPAGASADPSTR